MKKTYLLLAIFAAVGSATAWFVATRNPEKSTIVSADKNFAVQNTDEIEKIFIADRLGKSVTLQRKNGVWMIDGTNFKVRKTAINVLLETIKKMTVKYVPTQAATPIIVSELASSGIKVEIFGQENKKIRSYYIGGVTSDERGTYMIMDGSNNPYVMCLPNWEGAFRVRYFLDIDEWRDKTVFEEDVTNIKDLSIEYPASQEKSFSILNENNNFSVQPIDAKYPKSPNEVKKGFIEAYLTGFKSLGAEAFENKLTTKDSIRATTPFCIVQLRRTDGSQKSLRLHAVPTLNGYGDPIKKPDGSPLVEHFLAEDEKGDFYLIQQVVFGKILWGYQSFF